MSISFPTKCATNLQFFCAIYSCFPINYKNIHVISTICNTFNIYSITICIQPFPYNMLRIRIFHIVDPFKIWNDQLAHPKGMREKLIAILLVIIFPQYRYGKYHTIGKQILRPSYLKIRLTILDSLIIFKRICMGPIQRLCGQLLDELKCRRSTLSHTFSR